MKTNPPHSLIKITNLGGTFHQKQLDTLLNRTGNVTRLSLTKDKTACYAQFYDVAGAERTYNSLNNLQWPADNPHKLSVEYLVKSKTKLFQHQHQPYSKGIMSMKFVIDNRHNQGDVKSPRQYDYVYCGPKLQATPPPHIEYPFVTKDLKITWSNNGKYDFDVKLPRVHKRDYSRSLDNPANKKPKTNETKRRRH